SSGRRSKAHCGSAAPASPGWVCSPLTANRHQKASPIASAHMRDLEVQEKFGVRFVTYWFEEDAGSAFCLVDSPDKESVEAAHSASHGLLPLNVVEVDEAMQLVHRHDSI